MNRLALSLALCALTAAPALGQASTIDVPTSSGKVSLPVQFIAGSGEKIAHASTRSAEPDGVMVLPMPETGYLLRTERFKGDCDVTTMVAMDKSVANAPSSGSTCTSRWNADGQAHCLVSAIASGENSGNWSQRHSQGMSLITSVYAPSNGAAPAMPSMSEAAPAKDTALTAWIDNRGIQHEVSTRRNEAEKRDAFLARHRQALRAFANMLQPKG